MEIGYLWLTLCLFLFLMTTGAAFALVAVAFPLVAQAGGGRFSAAYHLFRTRRIMSYGVLALLSLVFGCLLLLFPPYSLPDRMVGWMTGVFGLIFVTDLGSWFVSRKLRQEGHDSGLLRKLGLLLWVGALAWLAGSCVLAWALVDVVGLV